MAIYSKLYKFLGDFGFRGQILENTTLFSFYEQFIFNFALNIVLLLREIRPKRFLVIVYLGAEIFTSKSINESKVKVFFFYLRQTIGLKFAVSKLYAI